MLNNEEVMNALEKGYLSVDEALHKLTDERATDGNGLAIGTVVAIRRPDPSHKGEYITEIRKAGFRDWENTQAIKASDTFRIYSATKTFTADVIKILQQQGKLALSDKLADWIQKIASKNIEDGNPELNTALDKLHIHPDATIEDLLMHRSGIGNYSQGAFFYAANQAPGKDWSLYDLFAYNVVVTDGADKNNAFGQFCYSDTGYNLLTLISEHASGKAYEILVQDLCAAEGLSHTCFIRQAKELEVHETVHIAHGYVMNPQSGKPTSSMDYDTSKGAGGLLSTAEDMLVWAKRFYSKNSVSLTDDKTIAVTGKTPSRCGEARYGNGIMVQDNGFGQKLFGHGGYARGGRSKVYYYPDSDTSIVTLESFESITPTIAKEMAKENPAYQNINKTTLLLRDAYTDTSGKFDRARLLSDWQKDRNIVMEKVTQTLHSKEQKYTDESQFIEPKMTKAWQPLQIGDKVAVAFPSHRPQYQSDSPDIIGTPATEIACHKKWIRSLGLEPHIPDDLATIEEWGERQDAARRRAQHIIDALADPTIKAIYATGGHGGDEVIHVLEQYYSNPENLPKRTDALPLIGFSDATQLQLYLGEKGLASPIQASRDGGAELQNLLFEQALQQNIPLTPVNDAAKISQPISGTMIGGNDSAICWAHRSNYRLQTAVNRNNILLLEGWNRYGVPQVLEMLQKQGQLDNGSIKAIVLGKCYGNNGNDTTIEEIDKAVKNLNIPVFIGAPIGHTRLRPEGFLPIPLNTVTTIQTTGDKSTISIHPTRTKEDIEAAKASYVAREPWTPSVTKDSSKFLTASPVFQPIILRPIHSDIESKVPKHFTGCCVYGSDIPAMEGVDLQGQNLLIHNPIPEHVTEMDYHSSIQKATIPMMELVKMGNAAGIKSITFSAPIAFPERFMESIREFTNEHFPGKPIFTTRFLHKTETAKQLESSSHQPLLVNFKNVMLENTVAPNAPEKSI